MILIASICFSGFFKICYMRNKKKDETKLFIKETKTWTIKHFGHVKEHGLYRKQTKFKRHVFMKYGSLGLWASSCPWQLQLAQPPPQPGWTDSVNLCFAKPFFPPMSATCYVYSCSVESKLQVPGTGLCHSYRGLSGTARWYENPLLETPSLSIQAPVDTASLWAGPESCSAVANLPVSVGHAKRKSGVIDRANWIPSLQFSSHLQIY